MSPTDLPTFAATWWPIQLETVPGSGERLTVAVVVRSASGQATVRQVLDPTTLMGMFGGEGKGMQFIVGTTVLKLREQLEALVTVPELQLPFSGIDLGTPRDCVARDANEVFGIATMLSSGFALSSFARQDDDEDADEGARLAFSQWADEIRQQVLMAEAADRWAHAFNIPLPLTGRKSSRFGFVGGSYVAQFGVLRPGRTISGDLRALKLKLFDLEVVRRELPLQIRTAELVVNYPENVDQLPSRQRETLSLCWEHIAHEARERHVGALRYQASNAAAEHVMSMAQA